MLTIREKRIGVAIFAIAVWFALTVALATGILRMSEWVVGNIDPMQLLLFGGLLPTEGQAFAVSALLVPVGMCLGYFFTEEKWPSWLQINPVMIEVDTLS